MTLKIYYAHPLSWYDTLNETYDVKLLEQHGEVINPNSRPFTDMVDVAKRNYRDTMAVFTDYIKTAAVDVVAFRPFKDGKISAGVAMEILAARVWGKPVWHVHNSSVDKMPSVPHQFDLEQAFTLSNILTVEQTRDRIKRGQL